MDGSLSIKTFKPSALLESVNLARTAVDKLSQQLTSLSKQATAWIKKDGDRTVTIDAVRRDNRELAQSLLKNEFSPERSITKQVNSDLPLSSALLSTEELDVANLIFNHYELGTNKKAVGKNSISVHNRILQKLGANAELSFDTDVKPELETIEAIIDSSESELADLKRLFKGVRIQKGAKGNVKKLINLSESPFTLLQDTFSDNSKTVLPGQEEQLNTLAKYKHGMVNLLLGTMSSRIFTNKTNVTRQKCVSSPEFENFRIALRALIYFAKVGEENSLN
jgi:hypothetical protein